MCSLRFENNLLTSEGVRFASISKKTPLSKLSFAFVSLPLPLLVMRGERKTSLPPPTVFLRKVVREYSARTYWSTAEHCKRRGALAFSYLVSRAYKCKILKFGFSYWIMSPLVGLTLPVSYTFCLLNNIMVEFQGKVWKHKLSYSKCVWSSYFFKFLTSLVLQ